jgi:hypothetical protein
MDNIKITANTDVISRQAGELKHYCDEVSKDFQTIQDAISGTVNCWKGSAGEAHRNKMAEFVGEISRCLKEISSYPDKLGIIATEYTNEDIEEVNTLESDIKI